MMFQRIENRGNRFPQNGKLYLAITKWGIVFSKSVKFDGFKRVDILWEPETQRLGVCPIKSRLPNSFSLGWERSQNNSERHIAGNSWIRTEILPICENLKKNIFQLKKHTDIQNYEGETVYIADLSNKVTNKE